jgi:hypothetical protein
LYLLRSEFWGGAVAAIRRRKGRDVGTLALIVVSLLLAMSIGPFSAIIILPRFRSWPMPDNYPGLKDYFDRTASIKNESALSYAAFSTAGLYPMNISEAALGISFSCEWDITHTDKPPCDNLLNVDYESLIPQTVILSTTAQNLEDSYYQDQMDSFAEMTATTTYMGYTSLFVASDPSDMAYLDPIDGGYVAISAFAGATMTTKVVNSGLGYHGTLLSDNSNLTMQIRLRINDQAGKSVAVKQPIVFSSCIGYVFTPNNFTAATQLPVRGGGILPSFNLTVGEAVAALYHQPGRPASFMSFLDVQEQVTFPISTAALFVTPLSTNSWNATPYDVVHLCLVSASWIEADTWLNIPARVSGSHPEYRIRDKVALAREVPNLDPADLIAIDPAFMTKLNIKPFNDGSRQSDGTGLNSSSAYEYIATRCAGNPVCLGLSVSGMLAYTISLAQCAFIDCFDGYYWTNVTATHVNFTLVNNAAQAEASGNYSRMTIQGFVSTYGYDFDDNIPAIIGFVILLLHITLVLIHVTMIVFNGFWTSDAWTSLGELIVLAAGSSPSAILNNNGAGVRKWRKWQLTAKVREAVPEERLELVFGRENDTKK